MSRCQHTPPDSRNQKGLVEITLQALCWQPVLPSSSVIPVIRPWGAPPASTITRDGMALWWRLTASPSVTGCFIVGTVNYPREVGMSTIGRLVKKKGERACQKTTAKPTSFSLLALPLFFYQQARITLAGWNLTLKGATLNVSVCFKQAW